MENITSTGSDLLHVPLHFIEGTLVHAIARCGFALCNGVLHNKIVGNKAPGPEGNVDDEGNKEGKDVESVEVAFSRREVALEPLRKFDCTEDTSYLKDVSMPSCKVERMGLTSTPMQLIHIAAHKARQSLYHGRWASRLQISGSSFHIRQVKRK